MTALQYEQFLRAEQAYLREPDDVPEDKCERDEDFERDLMEDELWQNA